MPGFCYLMVTSVAPYPYCLKEASWWWWRLYFLCSSHSMRWRNTPSPLPWMKTIFCPRFNLYFSIVLWKMSSWYSKISLLSIPAVVSSTSFVWRSISMTSLFVVCDGWGVAGVVLSICFFSFKASFSCCSSISSSSIYCSLLKGRSSEMELNQRACL